MKKILSTNNLSIGYSSKKETKIIAENINLSFNKGKLIALVGENGIGKSTLLKTLTGIQKPILGDIFLNEKNLKNYSNLEIAKNLSLVLTENLSPNNLSIYELIALGRQPYTNWIGKLSKEDVHQIDNAIKITNIEHLKDKKNYQISDGQLQIAMIARALAQDTPLIILDEPTTHLDLVHKFSLLKLLKKLTKETSKCILFSTHDIDLAIQLTDEIVVMTNNNLVQDSPCKLIEAGVFDNLFQDKNIVFDKLKGKFVLNN